LRTAWPPHVATRRGISGLGTLVWVSGVCIARPVPASSALNSSYALHVRRVVRGGPVGHHFVSSAGEAGDYFVHDEGFCADWDTFPGGVGDVSETGADGMP
jgi:hypothetical protein